VAIAVTEAGRNFAGCVNRAHYQNTSFVLLKNGKPVARLVPESERVCTGRDLAETMGKAGLSAAKARAWHKDLTGVRTEYLNRVSGLSLHILRREPATPLLLQKLLPGGLRVPSAHLLKARP
jgi:prevent-host-death family protein